MAVLGVASGEVVHITAAAVGLSALFADAPAVFTALRQAGAGYLAYLGVQALRRAWRADPLWSRRPRSAAAALTCAAR
ncbi:LysE family translocator [Amycolatopsis sp. FDAARGOS 1241]|uniref:LysE family translocator n=1 Tax=Amycolatopsis sp. FDAARGOS 1241 TaxID=2778070 RepID=UPI001EF37DD3|nr:LysE family transporter [Amycolatopsis sp. FDAARGOS 1241]